MEKLKILQVNKMYYPIIGGIEKVVQQIAEGLIKTTDMKVLVCSKKGKGSCEVINGVDVVRAGSIGTYFSMPVSFSFPFRLRQLSKNKNVLIFHMPFPLGDIAGLLSGYHGKIIVWWHSDVVKQKKLMKLYEPIMRRFLKRVDVIITATEGHINGSAYLGEFREKCMVIPYGVDQTFIEDSNMYLLEKVEITDKKEVVFLFVGRFVYYKGCQVLIEAFSKLETGSLIMAGDGYLIDELKSMVGEYALSERVTFVINPKDSQLKKLYRGCDVFVLPSIERTEAFGLVQIEVMSYGKPVINTNLKSGVPYVSIHQQTGLTVEPGNVDELYLAMDWMIANEYERKKMGIRAEVTVREKFLIENMLKNIIAVCN